MADVRCTTCRWAEIQPALFFSIDTQEICGHPEAYRAPYRDDLDFEVPGRQIDMRTMRRGNFPCGPKAALREAKP